MKRTTSTTTETETEKREKSPDHKRAEKEREEEEEEEVVEGDETRWRLTQMITTVSRKLFKKIVKEREEEKGWNLDMEPIDLDEDKEEYGQKELWSFEASVEGMTEEEEEEEEEPKLMKKKTVKKKDIEEMIEIEEQIVKELERENPRRKTLERAERLAMKLVIEGNMKESIPFINLIASCAPKRKMRLFSFVALSQCWNRSIGQRDVSNSKVVPLFEDFGRAFSDVVNFSKWSKENRSIPLARQWNQHSQSNKRFSCAPNKGMEMMQ